MTLLVLHYVRVTIYTDTVGARSRHVYIMATGLGEDMNLGSYRWHAASRTLRAGDFQILDVRLQIGLISSNMW